MLARRTNLMFTVVFVLALVLLQPAFMFAGETEGSHMEGSHMEGSHGMMEEAAGEGAVLMEAAKALMATGSEENYALAKKLMEMAE